MCGARPSLPGQGLPAGNGPFPPPGGGEGGGEGAGVGARPRLRCPRGFVLTGSPSLQLVLRVGALGAAPRVWALFVN